MSPKLFLDKMMRATPSFMKLLILWCILEKVFPICSEILVSDIFIAFEVILDYFAFMLPYILILLSSSMMQWNERN